jgi:hypothetical protein
MPSRPANAALQSAYPTAAAQERPIASKVAATPIAETSALPARDPERDRPSGAAGANDAEDAAA